MTTEQKKAYLEGHRWNPLTTTPTGGRLLSAFQLPWFLLLPPQGFGVLTTKGRKSGKRRRRCVRAIREGASVYLVSLRGSKAGWVLNLNSDPHVGLRIRGGHYRGLAREITEQDERSRAKEIYAETVNRFDHIEYRMHRSGGPSAGRIREMHSKWFEDGTPILIELEDNRVR